MDPMWISGVAGILGLLFALYLVRFVLSRDMGTDKMKEISAAIQEGAQAFLGREYRILAVFVIVVAVILGVVPNLGWLVSLTFVFGALSSALSGFIGMSVAVRSNARTAWAAKETDTESGCGTVPSPAGERLRRRSVSTSAGSGV